MKKSLNSSLFSWYTLFRQWELWFQWIPGRLPDTAQISRGFRWHPRKGIGRFPGLPPAQPAEAVSQTRGSREWNKTDKWVECWPFFNFFFFFTTIPVLNDLRAAAGGAPLWCHCLGSPVLWARAISSLHDLRHAPEEGAGDGPEKWRKIGDHKEDSKHPSMQSRDWKLSCCNYRLWNRCGTH